METPDIERVDTELPSEPILRRRLLLWALVVLFLCVGVLLHVLRKAEPQWNGRDLSSWLSDLVPGAGISELTQNQAEDAIRAIGTNSIPVLLTRIGSDDSRVKKAIYNRLPRSAQIRWNPYWATDYQWSAARAFGALGTNGAAALPKLSAILGDPAKGRAAAAALAGIGMAAFPVLTNLLLREKTAPDAAYGLTKLGDSALPPLIYALMNTNRAVHNAALAGLRFTIFKGYYWSHPDYLTRGSTAFRLDLMGSAVAEYHGNRESLMAQALALCSTNDHQEVKTAAKRVKTDLNL